MKLTKDQQQVTLTGLLLILLGVVILFACLQSCNVVKQVLKSPDKTNQVGIVWEKTHGCVNDTITNILPGKDSVRYDTLEVMSVAVIHDTLTNTDTRELLKYITKTIQRTDTVKSLIEDQRRVKIFSDSLIYYHGYRDELKNEVSAEKKRGNSWKLKFYGLLTLSFLVTALSVYFKFKKSFIKPKII